MLLLACSVSCWGEARFLGYTDQRSATSEQPSQPLSTLWQKADESLRIIEESLIAQGEPVQNLSKDLPVLYQKSQELQESVNALSQRFESFERTFNKLSHDFNKVVFLSITEILLFISVGSAVAVINRLRSQESQ
jgi:hypothetical protein